MVERGPGGKRAYNTAQPQTELMCHIRPKTLQTRRRPLSASKALSSAFTLSLSLPRHAFSCQLLPHIGRYALLVASGKIIR